MSTGVVVKLLSKPAAQLGSCKACKGLFGGPSGHLVGRSSSNKSEPAHGSKLTQSDLSSLSAVCQMAPCLASKFLRTRSFDDHLHLDLGGNGSLPAAYPDDRFGSVPPR